MMLILKLIDMILCDVFLSINTQYYLLKSVLPLQPEF